MFDLRGAASTSSRRRRLLDWGLRHESELKALIEASAAVVGTKVERGFVTAMLWLKPLPWPVRVFSTTEEAEAWLLHRDETV